MEDDGGFESRWVKELLLEEELGEWELGSQWQWLCKVEDRGWGLSLGGLFALDRPTVLTLVSALVTGFVLFVQTAQAARAPKAQCRCVFTLFNATNTVHFTQTTRG